MEHAMAKPRLTSMPLDALLKLRDQVGALINRRVDLLKTELCALGEDYKEVGRIAIYGKKGAKKRKAAKNGRRTGRKATARSRPAKSAKKSARRSKV
jgi:hypothetical protein